jgi:hypothetical protein
VAASLLIGAFSYPEYPFILTMLRHRSAQVQIQTISTTGMPDAFVFARGTVPRVRMMVWSKPGLRPDVCLGKVEPVVVVGVGRVVVVTVRRPQVAPVVVPTAAAQNAVRAHTTFTRIKY